MLDTHILKYLADFKTHLNNLSREWFTDNLWTIRTLLNDVEIPKSTPSSKKVYDTLEDAFLRICRIQGKSSAEYDLELWKYYSNKLDKVGQ